MIGGIFASVLGMQSAALQPWTFLRQIGGNTPGCRSEDPEIAKIKMSSPGTRVMKNAVKDQGTAVDPSMLINLRSERNSLISRSQVKFIADLGRER
jgi:hypothetical protein